MSLEQIYIKTLELEGVAHSDNTLDELFVNYLSWLDLTTQKIGSLTELGMSRQESTSLYTRIANCIVSWVVDHDLKPSLAVVETFAARKTLIWAIFEASAYCGQAILSERAGSHTFLNEGEKTSLISSHTSENRMLRLLAVLSVNNATEHMTQTALSQDPDYAFAFWLGWTAERIRVTERALAAEQCLLEFIIGRDPVVIPRTLMECATSAYMYFTYMVHEQKHDMKAYLNRCFARSLFESGLDVPQLLKRPMKRDKPKMVIPLERFVSGHAMHRCYAEYIAWLAEEFETIALVNAKDIDEKSSAIFSRVIHKEPNWSMQDVVNIVSMESPDIIYFPSIGMNTWVIMMSNIRLAPVQVMTFGHPATSTSKHIDYVIQSHNERASSWSNFCTEHVVETDPINSNTAWCSFIPSSRLNIQCEPKSSDDRDELIRIAINAKVMKLNAIFLETLGEIRNQVSLLDSREIVWCFFPAEKGIGYDGLMCFLDRTLKSVNLYQYMSYASFIDHLSRSDLSLAPFPFGNTNSTVDALVLGVPVVGLNSGEPCSTDVYITEQLGLTQSCIVDDRDHYIDRAVKLITCRDTYRGFVKDLHRIDWNQILEHGDENVELECKGFVNTMLSLSNS